MTITKEDIVLLLTDLEDNGVNIGNRISQIYNTPILSSQDIKNILKFINDNRPLDLTLFYEGIRKSYNEKRSKLYINIVQGKLLEEPIAPYEIACTLTSYQLQATLYARKLEDSQMFMKQSRLKEVSMALNQFYDHHDLRNCIRLLQLLALDLKACEEIAGRDVPVRRRT